MLEIIESIYINIYNLLLLQCFSVFSVFSCLSVFHPLALSLTVEYSNSSSAHGLKIIIALNLQMN